MMTTEDSEAREGVISIAWNGAGIGSVTLDGAVFARVEWSEKRKLWCIEDSQGACLRHVESIHGPAASKDEAVALAEAMVRDGRMPSPAEAKAAAMERRTEAEKLRDEKAAKLERQRFEARAEAMVKEGRASTLDEARTLLKAFKAEQESEAAAEAAARQAEYERLRKAREKRANQPAELKRRAEQAAARAERRAKMEAESVAFYRQRDAEQHEREAEPLHEVLDNAFDLGDPDLWKSNSFAALKPRLIVHVEAVIASSYDKARIERAKAIYRKLTGAAWTPKPSKMEELIATFKAREAAAKAEDGSHG